MPDFKEEIAYAIQNLSGSDVGKSYLLSEGNVKKLCNKVESILLAEPNLLRITSPIVMVGDIHGQIHELRRIFIMAGDSLETPKLTQKYIFFGDYIDRGYYSCETIQLLLGLKLFNPDKIFLLRGNHESRMITGSYGFYEEIKKKYGNDNTYAYIMQVFDALPISAIVDNYYFCVHAGLSKDIKLVDQINSINRRVEIPEEGPMTDLLWSDPEES